MTWHVFLDPTFGGRLCLTLVHCLWQIALLTAVVWVIDRRWPRRSVEFSYALHVTALVAGLAAMPITFSVIDVAPARVVNHVGGLRALGVQSTESAPLATSPPVGDGAGTAHRRSVVDVHEPIAALPSRPIDKRLAIADASPPAWLPWTPWIVACYGVGVSLMLSRLAVGVWHAHGLGARAQILQQGSLVALLDSLATRWSMRVAPLIAIVDGIVVPKVVGFLRPVILIPMSATTGLSTDELEMVLAHELAHLRRHDMWVNLLQRLAEAILFFNPGLWYLSRRISTLREYCCDEMVCRTMVHRHSESRARYARALLHVVELTRPDARQHRGAQAPDRSQVAALAVNGRSPSELRRRISHLFGEPMREPLRLSRGGAISLAVLVLMVVFGPAVRQSEVDSAVARSAQPSDSEETAGQSGNDARAVDSATAEGARTLKFPNNIAVGIIYTRPASRGDFSFENGQLYDEWQRVGPARGIIRVAADRQVRLDVNKRFSAHLDWMQRLGPNDIEMLYARGTEIDDAQLRYVGRLTGLRHLDLRHNPITDAGIEHLKGLSRLQYLHLSAFRVHRDGFGVGDGAMAVVSQLPALENIDLRLTKVTDKGLAVLAKCKTLRSIGLAGTEVTDAGLKHLLEIPKLTSLSLGVYRDAAKVTDEGMKTIGQLTGLKWLRLSGTPITDDGLAHLSALKHLDYLDIDNTGVTEAGLLHLIGMSRLQTLGLSITVTDEGAEHLSRLPELSQISARLELSGAGVARLAKLPKLETLSLKDRLMTDAEMEHIGRMPSLKELSFSDCRISDRGLERIGNSQSIEFLWLGGIDMKTAGLAHLATMPKLKRLFLNINPTPGGQADWQSMERFTQLEDLRLIGEAFRSSDMRHLSNLRQLTNLGLHLHTPIDDKGIRHLDGLRSLENLEIEYSVVTDEGLQALAGLQELEYLTISCLATDKGLEQLQELESLRRLEFASPYVSDAGLAELAKKLPALQRIHRSTYRLKGSAITPVKKDAFFRRGTRERRKEKDALEDRPPPVWIVENWLNTNGQELTMDKLRGKVVLVDFWRTWNRQGEAILPTLKRLHEKYHKQGLVILGIHRTKRADNAKENVEEFVWQHEIPWPVAVDSLEFTATSWHVESIPSFHLIDRAGNLRVADIFEDHLEPAIQALLAE